MNELFDPRGDKPSASAWGIYRACRGSFLLSQAAKKLGKEAFGFGKTAKEMEMAERGTVMHAALAGVPGAMEQLTPDELATVRECQAIVSRILLEVFGSHITPLVLAEERMWDGRREYSGQADRIYVNEEFTTALIVDFKTMWGVQDPAWINAQLAVLALLLAQAKGFKGARRKPAFTKILGAIVQPNSAKKFTLADFVPPWQPAILTTRAFARKLQDPAKYQLAPGDHCRWCAARAICAPRRLATFAKIEPVIVSLEKHLKSGRLVEVKAHPIQAEDFPSLLEAAVWMEKLAADIQSSAVALEKAAPGSIKGWRLASPRKLRGVPKESTPDALDAAIEYGLDENEFLRCCRLTLGDLEKTVEQRLAVRQSECEGTVNDMLGDLIEVNYTEPNSLVKTTP